MKYLEAVKEIFSEKIESRIKNNQDENHLTPEIYKIDFNFRADYPVIKPH